MMDINPFMTPIESSFIMEDDSEIVIFLKFAKKVDTKNFGKRLLACVEASKISIDVSKCQVISGLKPKEFLPVVSAITSNIAAVCTLVHLGPESRTEF